MAGGLRALSRVQFAREVTSGTAITTSTVMWRGLGFIEDMAAVTFPDENIANLAGVDRSYIASVGGKITLTSPLNIFQLPYLCEMGIKSVNTGSADGSGSDKIYTYTLPTTARNVIAPYTLQGGDDNDAEQMAYTLCEQITLSGKANEAWQMSGGLFGRQVSDITSFVPSSLALGTSIDDLLFNKSKVYIDPTTGTIGTTQVTNSFKECTIKLQTGWFGQQTGDGQLYFSYASFKRPVLTVDLDFFHDGTSITRKTDWRNQVARLIRINVPGAALTTAGSTYANNTMRFDFAGKGLKVSPLQDANGENFLRVSYNSRYNATGTLYSSLTCALDGITALA